MQIPAGFIVLWANAIGSIPAGWQLCDGTNGTPDLRNKFVPGAGDTYAVDETGGNVNHIHDYTGDGHDHSLPAGAQLTAGGDFGFESTTDAESGGTDNGSSLPPFHALAYIMKL